MASSKELAGGVSVTLELSAGSRCLKFTVSLGQKALVICWLGLAVLILGRLPDGMQALVQFLRR